MILTKSASVLRAEARMSLQGKWCSLAGFTFLYMFLSVGIAVIPSFVPMFVPINMYTMSMVSLAIQFFLVIPFQMGYYFLIRQAQSGTPFFSTVFTGFKAIYYLKLIGTVVLMAVFVLLWSLLLIVPGVEELPTADADFDWSEDDDAEAEREREAASLLAEARAQVSRSVSSSRSGMQPMLRERSARAASITSTSLASLAHLGLGVKRQRQAPTPDLPEWYVSAAKRAHAENARFVYRTGRAGAVYRYPIL
ncbi:hypothetical protein KIPB_001107 [Kipferlia bialata]|uniref:Uncharacterized protein n=1 Tax=Kipferlia bialata TaxID=797122 RepID=A0A9K3CPM0_9EUKA|nr:hypothetical protein KIPB_001107 [Kipferlia bialata]|eukprot:g1107.t1